MSVAPSDVQRQTSQRVWLKCGGTIENKQCECAPAKKDSESIARIGGPERVSRKGRGNSDTGPTSLQYRNLETV